MKRAVAYRFRIGDLARGDYVAGKDINNPTFVRIGELQVTRVDLVGRIAEKSAGYIVIQDRTGRIKVRAFDDSLIKDLSAKELVRVIGKIRQDQTERFVAGEIIKKIDDANYELLREKELGQSLVEEISF